MRGDDSGYKCKSFLKSGIFAKKRKGQFYLVASVIIVVIVVGLITISNYSKSDKKSNIDKYGKEFEIESEKVLDYDALNGDNKIENFTKEYSIYMGNKINASYIYGTEGNMNAFTYLDGDYVDLNSDLSFDSDEMIFEYADSVYRFNIEKGKNFYFVFYQNIGGEKYVYTN
jgi:hypothetical protein